MSNTNNLIWLVLSTSTRRCREANSQSQMGYTVSVRGSSKKRYVWKLVGWCGTNSIIISCEHQLMWMVPIYKAGIPPIHNALIIVADNFLYSYWKAHLNLAFLFSSDKHFMLMLVFVTWNSLGMELFTLFIELTVAWILGFYFQVFCTGQSTGNGRTKL